MRPRSIVAVTVSGPRRVRDRCVDDDHVRARSPAKVGGIELERAPTSAFSSSARPYGRPAEDDSVCLRPKAEASGLHRAEPPVNEGSFAYKICYTVCLSDVNKSIFVCSSARNQMPNARQISAFAVAIRNRPCRAAVEFEAS